MIQLLMAASQIAHVVPSSLDGFDGTTWASGHWGFVGLTQDAHVVPSNGFDQNTRANCEPVRITKLVYHIGK